MPRQGLLAQGQSSPSEATALTRRSCIFGLRRAGACRSLRRHMFDSTANAIAAKADHNTKLSTIARTRALRAGHLADGASLFGSLRWLTSKPCWPSKASAMVALSISGPTCALFYLCCIKTSRGLAAVQVIAVRFPVLYLQNDVAQKASQMLPAFFERARQRDDGVAETIETRKPTASNPPETRRYYSRDCPAPALRRSRWRSQTARCARPMGSLVSGVGDDGNAWCDRPCSRDSRHRVGRRRDGDRRGGSAAGPRRRGSWRLCGCTASEIFGRQCMAARGVIAAPPQSVACREAFGRRFTEAV